MRAEVAVRFDSLIPHLLTALTVGDSCNGNGEWPTTCLRVNWRHHASCSFCLIPRAPLCGFRRPFFDVPHRLRDGDRSGTESNAIDGERQGAWWAAAGRRRPDSAVCGGKWRQWKRGVSSAE